MFNIESMTWNATDAAEAILREIIIAMAGVVVVDPLAMNIDEVADANGATASIRIGLIQCEVVEMITRQIVLVPIRRVTIAIVLLQKEIQEIRVGVVQKGTEDVGRGAIVVAKDPSKRLSFLKNEYKNVATKLILLSRGNSNIRSKICDY